MVVSPSIMYAELNISVYSVIFKAIDLLLLILLVLVLVLLLFH